MAMNIFYLHRDPKKAARYQYNKHVVKMILESAQMLCTAHHHYAEQCGYDNSYIPYKKAHYNHPSTKWVRENTNHYDWLWTHMIALGDEYTRRYGKKHLSIRKLYSHNIWWAPKGMPDSEFKQPPQAMPDQYKDPCSIKAYWNYYISEKHIVANKNERIYKEAPMSFS
jgi:hypothetical protein